MLWSRTNLGVGAGFVILLALVAEPVWEGREQWQFGPFRDDGVYMVAAKSVATGEAYRQINLPDQRRVTKYPPLYPSYLSLAWRIQPQFPRVLQTASALQAMLLPVYLALILLLLRQLGLSWRRTFLVAAWTIVSFSLILMTITLYSELLFGIFLTGAIFAIERAAGDDDHGVRWALLGGLLTGLAYLTRTAALPMLAAVPIFFFLRKRPRLCGPFFVFALPMAAGWHAWGAMHATGPSPYLDEYAEVIRSNGLLSHLLTQAALISATVAEELVPGITTFEMGIPLHHLVLAAAIAGAIRIGRRRNWPMALVFTAPYLLMIMCWWGSRQLGRFLIPIWPVLLAGIVEEGVHFAELCSQSIRRPQFKNAPRWALLALGLFLVIRNDRVLFERVRFKIAVERDERQKDLPAYSWIAAHAGRDTVVLTSKDTVSYLYTGVLASHDMFVTVIPQPEEVKTPREPLSTLPAQFTNALVVFLPSDFEDFSDRGMAPYRAEVESIPGSRLEYNGPNGTIYRLPIAR